MKPFPTDTMADISAVHLSHGDFIRLELLHRESCVIAYPTGWFVYTGGSDAGCRKDVIADYATAGLSPGTLRIIKAAGKQGCKWVCFDGDGPVIKGLKQYHY